MKIEHWAPKGPYLKTQARETVEVHSTGISGDTFELTGQVTYANGTESTLDTYVTVALTRDEVEQFVAAIAKTIGITKAPA